MTRIISAVCLQFFKTSTYLKYLTAFDLDHPVKSTLYFIITCFNPTFLFTCRFRQNLPVDYILKELAFDKKEDWKKFSQSFQLIYADADHTSLDCKASTANLSSIQ